MKTIALVLTLLVSMTTFAAPATPANGKISDEAVYKKILSFVEQGNWSVALDLMDLLTPDFRTKFEVVLTEAGIHSAKCGFDHISFMGRIIRPGTPFALGLNAMNGGTLNLQECLQAQSVIESNLGDTAANRVSTYGPFVGGQINTFMATLGLAKIGIVLRTQADMDRDGRIDAGFDACQTSPLKDTEVAHIGAGFALLLDNVSAIEPSLDPATAKAIGDIKNLCDSMNVNFCNTLSADDAVWAEPEALTSVRSLVKSKAFGIQACEGDPLKCCP